MDIVLTDSLEGIDWDAVSRIFEAIGWGRRPKDKLATAFSRSRGVRFAWEGERLAGFARALTDGEYYALISDVVVLPEFQGRGVGRMLVEALLEELGPLLFICLTSAPGKEDFYHRLGFRRQKTGMLLLQDLDTPRARALVEQ